MNTGCVFDSPQTSPEAKKRQPHAGQTIFHKEVTAMERRPEKKAPMKKAEELTHFTAAKTDPMGSWTGQPLDPYEIPVQDADDL